MNPETYYISRYCHISPNGLFVDGVVSENLSEPDNFEGFLKAIYNKNSCNYPKFFKMDLLSKMSFLGAELLLEAPEYRGMQTALVFSNRASSLETDRKHQASIAAKTDFYPSPAVFVYTLPNIGLGEIAIRQQLQTENAFFVFDSFQAEFLEKYTLSLLHQQKADQVLCAWVEVDGDKRHGFFYLVSRKGSILHNVESIVKIYNSR